MLHVKSYEISEVSGINEEEFRSSMLRCYAFVAELINSVSKSCKIAFSLYIMLLTFVTY